MPHGHFQQFHPFIPWRLEEDSILDIPKRLTSFNCNAYAIA